MTNAATILRAAQRLTNDGWRCAHIAINDATYDQRPIAPVREADDQYMQIKRIYAVANGLDPDATPGCIWRFWDNSTPEERAASWERAITAAEHDAALARAVEG